MTKDEAEKGEPKMNWTDHQNRIFTHVEDQPDTSAIIRAVAGSGKTTTLLEVDRRLKEPRLLLAFNKRIAEEMRARGAEASTFHAHGYAACRSRKIFKTNPRKVFNILEGAGVSAYSIKVNVQSLVSYAKNHMIIDPDAEIFLNDILPFVDFDEDNLNEQGYSELAAKVYKASVEDLSCVDFDDQIFFPLYHRWYLEKVSTLLVDEAQDLNAMQHRYIQKIVDNRIIVFGDPSQAIYGFRGAMANSMHLLGETYEAEWLPLTRTFRCPKRVTALAKALQPELFCPPTAEEGRIFHMGSEALTKELGLYNSNTMILCRNNAPLFRYALDCLERDIPFRFQGNFDKAMLALIYKFSRQSSETSAMRKACKDWLESQMRRWQRFPSRLALVQDKADCFLLLLDRCKTVAEMKKAIAEIAEGDRGLMLSTIHQAKGLEAKDVIFLYPSLIDAARERGDGAQEDNIEYVALTRAKETLTFVESDYGDRKEI